MEKRRKRRLREYIEKDLGGERGVLIARSGLTKGRIAQLLDEDEAFGERAARSLEVKLHLRPGFFDDEVAPKVAPDHKVSMDFSPYVTSDQYVYIPVYNVVAAMGNGGEVGNEEIIGKHSYSQAWLLAQNLDAKMLSRVKGTGQSMEPTIADGDTLLVNRGERRIVDGKVYAFRVDNDLRVKRLFRQMDGRVRVVSDNPNKAIYPDEFLSIHDMPEIIGRVRDRSGTNNL